MFTGNAINWFEIPTTDLDRAQKYYETILGMSLIPMDFPELKMRMFPVTDGKLVSGALVHNPEHYKPSAVGSMVYFNGNPDLQNILDKVEAAGGQILIPKTQISPEHGYMAVTLDTEGNRVAFHSGPEQ